VPQGHERLEIGEAWRPLYNVFDLCVKIMQFGAGLLVNFKLEGLCYFSFYRAMHFSAKRGIAIACRLSVLLSVPLSVCLSVTLVNCDHIG